MPRKPTTGFPDCCADAANGPAAAALPTSAMKSRLFTGVPILPRAIPYHTPKRSCCAALQIVLFDFRKGSEAEKLKLSNLSSVYDLTAGERADVRLTALCQHETSPRETHEAIPLSK